MLKVSPVPFLICYLLGPARVLADGHNARTAGTPSMSVIALADARHRALSASPDLQTLNAEVQAADGAARQARAFANPELALEAEDFGGERPVGVTPQSTVSLSQGIEWFGKRSARVEAAHHGSEVAVRDLARGRRDLLADVDRAFTALLGAQDRVAIAEQNAETAREVTRAVSSLVAAGEVSPVEEARAQGDEAVAAIDLENSRRDLDLACLALARLWGEDSPSSFVAAGTLAPSALLPDRESAMASLASLPDLTRWDAELARQTSLVELARKEALPNLKLSVGTRSYSGLSGRAFVAGLAIPIPLATQYAGAKAEASARQERIRLDRRAEEVRIRARFLAAHETLSRAIGEARALRDEVLPRAARVYEALNEGYRRGKFRLLDLLEARRTLAQTRLRYIDALVRLNTADADLRRLLPDDTDNSIGVQQ